MTKKIVGLTGLSLLLLLVAGCGSVTQQLNKAPVLATPQTQPPTKEISPQEVNTVTDKSVSEPIPEDTITEIPQSDNELGEVEFHWNQLLARDAIAPIYEPRFTTAGQAPYDDNELVIGVEINGEAKAYAIGPLNSREMVNDTVGGVPILVTW